MDLPVREGQVFAGKYRVERVIGAGGMGVVVSAEHIELHQRVALKFLKPEAAKKPDLVERFLREARAATRIRSEHVVRVLDVGRLDDGLPFLVMEFLEGVDLGERLQRGGALPVPDAVESILHACEALAIAHAQGIVHRDIKPANLFQARRPDGTPLIKLVDFGISKAALTGPLGEELALTGSQSVVGSPLYMSPEAMRSARRIDPRSDIWSLGVVLYELLTAELAFTGESIAEVCVAVMHTEPASLRLISPSIPDGLDSVVRRCLAKKPDDRFQTTADLAEGLLPFAPERARVLVERARAVATAGASMDLPAKVSPSGKPQALRSTPLRSNAESRAPRSNPALPADRGATAQARPMHERITVSGTAASAPATEDVQKRRPLEGIGWRGPALATSTIAMVLLAYVGVRLSSRLWESPASVSSFAAPSESSPGPSSVFVLRIESDPVGALVSDG
ncbi:MAG: serine/threonine protein kinase, partial [Polyangiaceae bacterium]|nr:serine/threonine protein kinase [Polyangiaceae bacterium]